MPQPQPFVSNIPLSLASRLRFTDSNGNLVTQLYPIGYPVDTPETGYISRIGAVLSQQVDLYDQVDQVLIAYNVRISTLETAVDAIEASGSTSIPYVNGGCLTSPVNQSVPINTVLATFIPIWCEFYGVTGNASSLTSGIVAMNTTTLNALPAYSQNSAMAGLTGWQSTPLTVAQWMNNMSLAYLDMRAGVTRALSQSNITCASIVVEGSGIYNNTTRTITLYFPGSYIPANFTDNGSHLLVEDTAGNQFTMNFNALTAVNTDGNLDIDISASALLQITDYTVTLTYNVTSTTPALGCSNVRVIQVANTTAVCPNISTSAYAGGGATASILFSFSPTVSTNVVYTIDLLHTSGSTSGTTIDTKTYNNPSVPIVDSFSGLTNATSYGVRATVTISGESTVCTTIVIITPS